MIKEVQLPTISENVDSGLVVGILVKAGDFVEEEQSIVELETEKATFEVPCPVAGKVVDIVVSEDDEVKVGQTIMTIDTEPQPGEQPAAQSQPEPEPETESRQAKEPASPEPEPSKGPEPSKEPEPRTEPQQEQGEEEPQPAEESTDQPSASPAVRGLARELGIDIRQVPPSEAGGKLSQEDVKNYARTLIENRQTTGELSPARDLPDFSNWGLTRREPMTATRRKIAETLSYAWSNVPHVTQHDEADITALERCRSEYSPIVERAGGKLTLTSILLKVTASALKVFPKFNASVDSRSNEIVFKEFCHIGVAVASDRGLLVPVVRDVNDKTILQLSVELKDLAEKARANKLKPDDMLGGNFTISNLGGLGGTCFSPIIYWPQVAILGVARAYEKPRYADGQFLQKSLALPLSLSYDHRLIDGIEGVRFLRHIIEQLEKPFLLAIGE